MVLESGAGGLVCHGLVHRLRCILRSTGWRCEYLFLMRCQRRHFCFVSFCQEIALGTKRPRCTRYTTKSMLVMKCFTRAATQ